MTDELDADLRDQDWIKTLAWDLPTDADAFLAVVRDVRAFAHLPAAERMPEELRAELERRGYPVPPVPEVRHDKNGNPINEDDHYYGAWVGGKAKDGGHPGTGVTLGSLAADVTARYHSGDFSGIPAKDAPVLAACIAEIDRLAQLFPEVISHRSGYDDRPWQFAGINTTATEDCPPNIIALMGDAWAGTKGYNAFGGPRIWINVADPEAFREGTGVMGDIGFTFEKTPVDGIVHEFGHVVHIVLPDALRLVNEAFHQVYGKYEHPIRMLMRDVGLYAGGSPEERFATLFAALHAPGGLARLPSDAARKRILAVQRIANAFELVKYNGGRVL